MQCESYLTKVHKEMLLFLVFSVLVKKMCHCMYIAVYFFKKLFLAGQGI